jgi:hypothetical protein
MKPPPVQPGELPRLTHEELDEIISWRAGATYYELAMAQELQAWRAPERERERILKFWQERTNIACRDLDVHSCTRRDNQTKREICTNCGKDVTDQRRYEID